MAAERQQEGGDSRRLGRSVNDFDATVPQNRTYGPPAPGNAGRAAEEEGFSSPALEREHKTGMHGAPGTAMLLVMERPVLQNLVEPDQGNRHPRRAIPPDRLLRLRAGEAVLKGPWSRDEKWRKAAFQLRAHMWLLKVKNYMS